MALRDIWDYIRASGDRRLREQGYVRSGAGILERYRRVPGWWGPHLENNREAIRGICARMKERGGTLLILGAGRLLDVPWEEVFPRFERVVLADADFTVVPYVERLIASSKHPEIKKPVFEIGDLTASVVDTAAWAEQTMSAAGSPIAAAEALRSGFERAGTPQPSWARTYADLRLIISTNLLSQLGYFPRLYIQSNFKRRYDELFSRQGKAAEALECYFDRVRARHIYDICSQRGAWAYLSSDIKIIVYQLQSMTGKELLAQTPPPDAGVSVRSDGEVDFKWPVKITEQSDPIHGQSLRKLFPNNATVEGPRHWAWHIVPQGGEGKYQNEGRVHVVESWIKQPS